VTPFERHKTSETYCLSFCKVYKGYYGEAINCQYSKKGKQENFTNLRNICIYKVKITEYKEIIVSNFAHKAASFIQSNLRMLYNKAEPFNSSNCFAIVLSIIEHKCKSFWDKNRTFRRLGC